jgi:hypothetical protein
MYSKDEKVTCAVCGFLGKSLITHVIHAHGLTPSEYTQLYNAPIESSSIKIKRRETSLSNYGVPHYTNREAAKLSFELYEGGHPMRDPSSLERYKRARALNPHYDKESAKKTSLERYGEEFFARTEGARRTSRENMGKLQESGRAYSGKNRKDCPDREGLKKAYLKGSSLGGIALLFKVSDSVVSRWIKECGLERGESSGTERKEPMSKEDLIEAYKKECLERKELLSPYTFGKIKGDPALVCKLKRVLARDPSLKDTISSKIVL